MIVYKIDRQSHNNASKQIQDMSVILDEIAPTLEVLQKLLQEHQEAISTPTIDSYREDLKQAVAGAAQLSRTVAENAKQLCAVSDQATRHLTAIDEHFGGVLRESQATNERVVAKV